MNEVTVNPNEIPALSSNIANQNGSETIYEGFPKSGITQTSAEAWAIRRTVISDTGTEVTWAKGNTEKNKSFDERANYNYRPL